MKKVLKKVAISTTYLGILHIFLINLNNYVRIWQNHIFLGKQILIYILEKKIFEEPKILLYYYPFYPIL